MNKEAYVSFEVAKLLKKKGFDWEVNGYFCSDVDNPLRIEWSTKDYNSHKFHVSAPTQQMACRWLYEEKGFYIAVLPFEKGFRAMIYHTMVSHYLEYLGLIRDEEHNSLTPQQAVEAALEYCLTNLI